MRVCPLKIGGNRKTGATFYQTWKGRVLARKGEGSAGVLEREDYFRA